MNRKQQLNNLMTKSSALLTKALVEEAIRLVTPAINEIIKLDPKRNIIYIYVFGPLAGDQDQPTWQGAVGEQDQSKWTKDYSKAALAKAAVSLQTGLPSHMVQHEYAHLYVEGDFKYGGSEVRKGIVVAASGLAWHHDYAVSAMLAAVIDALVKGAFDAEYLRKALFIGAPEENPVK
jgi:hypothetical protein